METVGTYLKREREFRQIPLKEVSVATRISVANLEAIERDQFEELPSKTFVRGYLKSYAEQVGLDGDDVLLRYEQWLKSDVVDQPEQAHPEQSEWHFRWKHLWIGAVVALLVFLASYLSS